MKLKLIIGICVVIVLCVGVGVGIYFATKSDKVEEKTSLGLPDVFLVASTRLGNVQLINFKDIDVKEALVEDSRYLISAYDYYAKNKTVFYATTQPNSPIKSSSEEFANLTASVDWTKTALAVDYVTEKLYTLDRESKTIYVSDLQDTYTSAIFSNFTEDENPTDIVIDPSKHLLFVAKDSSIAKMSMDGSEYVDIISNLVEVSAMTIDYANSRIYFASKNFIQSIDYLTRRIRYVLELSDNVVSLSYAKDHLFFLHEEEIVENIISLRGFSSCKLVDGYCKDSDTDYLDILTSANLLKIKVFPVEETVFENPCENNGDCEQLCVLSRQKPGYTCTCEPGLQLNEDGKSCSKALPYVPSKVTLFFNLYVGYISTFDFETRDLERVAEDFVNPPSNFDYYVNKTLYYTTTRPNSEIISASDEYSNITKYVKDRTKTAIAIEPVSGKMYVVDRELSRLYLTDLENKYGTIVRTNLNEPSGIALDPIRKIMFILESPEENPSVLKLDMDGTNPERLKLPAKLITIDFNNSTLYFATPYDIISYNYVSGEMVAVLPIKEEIISMSYAANHLFFIHESKAGKRSFSFCTIIEKRCQNLQRDALDPTMDEAYKIVSLKAYDMSQSAFENVCGEDNGGCKHLCVLNSKTEYSCLCDFQYILNPDKKTCSKVE